MPPTSTCCTCCFRHLISSSRRSGCACTLSGWYVAGWEESSSTLREGWGKSAPMLLCGVRWVGGVRGVRGVGGVRGVASGGGVSCPVIEKRWYSWQWKSGQNPGTDTLWTFLSELYTINVSIFILPPKKLVYCSIQFTEKGQWRHHYEIITTHEGSYLLWGGKIT